MDERHCGNSGWHLSHRWGEVWAEMGTAWWDCPGSYPDSDPRSSTTADRTVRSRDE